jgi:2Fe-2S ferredoxin
LQRRFNNTLRGLGLPSLSPLSEIMPNIVSFIPTSAPNASTRPTATRHAVATGHGVNEIVSVGGNAMCATCHVYVDEGWIARLAAMSAEKNELLDGVAAGGRRTAACPARSRSRRNLMASSCACQNGRYEFKPGEPGNANDQIQRESTL